MNMKLERRLRQIKEALGKGHSALMDMTDDELAQVITGNLDTRANDISPEQLENIARGLSNETRTQTSIS